MPCTGQQGGYNPYNEEKASNRCFIETRANKGNTTNLITTVKNYEAALCAIIRELEKRGIASEIMNDSSLNGFIDIISFWEKHVKSDEARINEKLKQFSKHEKKIIKDILNK